MLRKVRLTFVVALMGAALFLIVGEPGSQAAIQFDPPTPPTAEEVVGDIELPFSGMGAVYLRPDGLVLIEAGDEQSTAFTMVTDDLYLTEDQNGKVEFRDSSGIGDPLITVLHEYAEMTPEDARECSAIFRHVGDLSLDYDEEKGILDVVVDGGNQSFRSDFDLSTSSAVVIDEQAANWSCYCEYFGPPGGSCNSGKICPVGYECSCKCNQGGCICSRCTRVGRGDALPVIPEY